ncbi:MAG: hypothetical protein LBH56_04045, partial [Coriobacteriales bacterium]|nr:hypothetical protein [Coriobacteriales bacterium]
GAALLEKEIEAAVAAADSLQNAQAFCAKVLPAMRNVRAAVDAAELLVGDEYWPVPTYNEILFYT